MANLKNNTLKKNLHLMTLAFEQAKINLGSTKKNLITLKKKNYQKILIG